MLDRRRAAYYVRSCDVAELSDDVIDVVVEHGSRIVSPITSVALWQMGGAVRRVGESETAFNNRDAVDQGEEAIRHATGRTSTTA